MNYYLHVLKNYANFNGRARRKEYWMFVLFHIIIYYALFFIGMSAGSGMLMMLASIYILATLIPSIAAGVRRMHDVGKSGWYILIPIYSLILACTDSEPGSNEYGPNPKEIGSDDATDHIVESN